MSAARSVDEALRPWRDADRVPLHELGDRLGVGRGVRQNAIDQGLITPAGRAGVGAGYTVSREDAERFTRAVFLAAVIGVGVIVALRILSGSGVSATGGGVFIPVPGVST